MGVGFLCLTCLFPCWLFWFVCPSVCQFSSLKVCFSLPKKMCAMSRCWSVLRCCPLHRGAPDVVPGIPGQTNGVNSRARGRRASASSIAWPTHKLENDALTSWRDGAEESVSVRADSVRDLTSSRVEGSGGPCSSGVVQETVTWIFTSAGSVMLPCTRFTSTMPRQGASGGTAPSASASFSGVGAVRMAPPRRALSAASLGAPAVATVQPRGLLYAASVAELRSEPAKQSGSQHPWL